MKTQKPFLIKISVVINMTLFDDTKCIMKTPVGKNDAIMETLKIAKNGKDFQNCIYLRGYLAPTRNEAPKKVNWFHFPLISAEKVYPFLWFKS